MAGTKRKGGSLPTVQETVLKRRKAAAAARSSAMRQQARDRRLQRHKKRSSFTRVEKLVKRHRLRERDSRRVLRLSLRPAAASAVAAQLDGVAFVIRRRGGSGGQDERVERALRLLRLTRPNTGVFVRSSDAALAVLRLLDPYVAWGFPDLRSVRDLVYKRGHAVVDGKRRPLTDNALVEERLGQHGLICIEDLVHEIATGGDKFTQAASFLCPFRLKPPLGGWKRLENVQVGSAGRGEFIARLLRSMV